MNLPVGPAQGYVLTTQDPAPRLIYHSVPNVVTVDPCLPMLHAFTMFAQTKVGSPPGRGAARLGRARLPTTLFPIKVSHFPL